MLIVRLKPKKEAPAMQGHPWIYSGAVDKVQGEPENDRLCRVLNAKGQFVCQGMYNPVSQLAVRVLTLGKEPVDRSFFQDRIRSAAALRRRIVAADTSCYRLVNSEGDRLPGLVVDRYNDMLVVQLITPFMDDFKAELVDMLRAEFPSCSIFERSDTRTRSNEGFRPSNGPLWGDFDSWETTVQEHGLEYAVDILTGDRTGFYLEHSLTRQRIRAHARDKKVLDLFSYTGSFSVSALAGGAASVVSVDTSAPAQVLLKRNMELHRIRPFVWRHGKDDAARFLADDRTLYDMVLCDAPAFGNEFEEHCRMVNLAMARVSPGGILFSLAPVTAQFGSTDLLKAIALAAKDLSRTARILEPLSQSEHFPWLPTHPQGMHQTGFVVHVD
jgi:23S rRNA (cytosine1962-C5)-methyltransferase